MFENPWRPLPDIGDPPAGQITDDDELDLTPGGTPEANQDPFYSSASIIGIPSPGATIDLNGEIWIENDGEGSGLLFTDGSATSITTSGSVVVKSPGQVRFELFSNAGYAYSNTGEIFLLSEDSASLVFNPLLPNSVADQSTITNDGTIEVWAGADRAIGADLSYAGTFTNSGTVSASGFAEAIGVRLGTDPDLLATLNNGGLIEAYDDAAAGQSAIGVFLYAIGDVLISNTGTIRAETAISSPVFLFQDGEDPLDYGRTVDNGANGIIDGDVRLYDTLDSITNDGSIIGDVMLGAGNDVFESEDGTFDGTLYLEEGDDIGIGSAGNDTFYGGEGADSLAGGQGSDLINGGDGNDVIYGDALPEGVDWLV